MTVAVTLRPPDLECAETTGLGMPATLTDLSCGSITLAVSLLCPGTDPVIKEFHGEPSSMAIGET